jgi:hypothetical protein
VAITHVNTTSAVQAGATSVTVTKPGTVAEGDVMLAFFTSNDQNCTPPAGWTEFSDTFISTFRCQAFYKVAGGSEAASYAFTVPVSAPLVCQITAWRGVDNANIFDGTTATSSGTALGEGVTTPSIDVASAGRLIYFRAVRFEGSTVPTFTSSATERSDTGVFSGGSVCYSNGLYSDAADYSTSGTKSGASITCSQAESHNLTLTAALAVDEVPGDLAVDLPLISSVDMTGDVAVPGDLEVTLPELGPVEIGAFYGAYEGPLDVDVPIGMDFQVYTGIDGTLDVTISPTFESVGETRYFSDSVINIAREERWMILTQDDMRPGIRNTKISIVTVDLPSLNVGFNGEVNPAKLAQIVQAVANSPVASVKAKPVTAPTAAVVANNATVSKGKIGLAGHASVSCHN